MSLGTNVVDEYGSVCNQSGSNQLNFVVEFVIEVFGLVEGGANICAMRVYPILVEY